MKARRLILLLFLLFLLVSLPSHSQDKIYRVKRVVDGDTLLLTNGEQPRLKDGTFLNAEIIKQGYGFAYTRFPFAYMEDFRGYEREAKENKRGLWGDDSVLSRSGTSSTISEISPLGYSKPG